MSVEAFRYRCAKHGEHTAYLYLRLDGVIKLYCLICLDETLTRMGVHAMFPIGRADKLAAQESDEWIPKAID